MPRMPLTCGARLVVLLLAAGLSACASSGAPGGAAPSSVGSYYRGLSCAPFARALSGVRLYGDAWQWWQEASGRYPRTAWPEVGAVLVLRRSARLPDGHVAVVSRLLGPRQVLLIQANWVPERLTEDQLAVDVSPGNDWTAVRIWWPPTGALGSHTYAAYGFILPPRPQTHEALRRAAEPAAELALAPHLPQVTLW